MKIFKSIGIDTGTNQEFVVGYFFEGDGGLFAFSQEKEASDDLQYNIVLDTSSDYLREFQQ